MEWPPYSPDLNQCYFFLWGYLKDGLYKDAPANLNGLGKAIRKQTTFSNTVLNIVHEGKIDYKKIIFTDKCHYHLEGFVNKQNWRHWGSEPPNFVAVQPLHPKRVTVWEGIYYGGVIGPIVFQNSVTGEAYTKLLKEKIIPELESKDLLDDHWWMQDEAPPHRVSKALQVLNDNFQERVIGLDYPKKYGIGMDWPANSPDLNPIDFLTWGYTKDKSYKGHTHNMESLQDAIKASFTSIPTVLCGKLS
uniref:Tc1-like transposase DDE domain-containing protein n=1 Tax=Tetranychus urticae TaxID=32264 RepID=A0A158P4I2_TETUR